MIEKKFGQFCTKNLIFFVLKKLSKEHSFSTKKKSVTTSLNRWTCAQQFQCNFFLKKKKEKKNAQSFTDCTVKFNNQSVFLVFTVIYRKLVKLTENVDYNQKSATANFPDRIR